MLQYSILPIPQAKPCHHCSSPWTMALRTENVTAMTFSRLFRVSDDIFQSISIAMVFCNSRRIAMSLQVLLSYRPHTFNQAYALRTHSANALDKSSTDFSCVNLKKMQPKITDTCHHISNGFNQRVDPSKC